MANDAYDPEKEEQINVNVFTTIREKLDELKLESQELIGALDDDIEAAPLIVEVRNRLLVLHNHLLDGEISVEDAAKGLHTFLKNGAIAGPEDGVDMETYIRSLLVKDIVMGAKKKSIPVDCSHRQECSLDSPCLKKSWRGNSCVPFDERTFQCPSKSKVCTVFDGGKLRMVAIKKQERDLGIVLDIEKEWKAKKLSSHEVFLQLQAAIKNKQLPASYAYKTMAPHKDEAMTKENKAWLTNQWKKLHAGELDKDQMVDDIMKKHTEGMITTQSMNRMTKALSWQKKQDKYKNAMGKVQKDAMSKARSSMAKKQKGMTSGSMASIAKKMLGANKGVAGKAV